MTDLHKILGDFATLPLQSREEVEAREARQTRRDRVEAMRDAITAEDRDAVIAGDERGGSDALRAVRRWLRVVRGELRTTDGRPRPFLALLGERGRGKTVAAAWALAELGGVYVEAPELARLGTSKHWADAEKFDLLRRARVLVIDDVGTEGVVDGLAAGVYWSTINGRQGGRHLTVLTGNVTAERFAELLGERAIDRVRHQGAVVVVGGPDLRRGGQ